MYAAHCFVLAMGLTLAPLAPVCSAAAAEGKVTGESTFLKVNAKTSGFCGMVMLEIDHQPAACFGLHQSPGGKPRYTYLLLFKPNPAREPGMGVGGEGPSTIGTDGTAKCDLKMTAYAGGREIKVDYKLDADAQRIASESLTVGGQESTADGPRVFLVDLADDKAACHPVKVTLQAVPDFADEDAWGKQILAAVKELKEKSAEAKAFFDGKK